MTTAKTLQRSYWAPLLDVLPLDVVAKMDAAVTEAIHRPTPEQQRSGEPVLMVGIRALIAHYADSVSHDEHNARIAGLLGDHMAELKEVRATAEDKAKREYGERLREANTRVANVKALLVRAGKRKTMSTDEVRAAVQWQLGEELPQATREVYGR